MYDVNVLVRNDWGQGFTAEIIITNLGNTPLNDWLLEFDAPFEITNLWNANLESATAGSYKISNLAWNGTIAPGDSVSFGLNGLKTQDIAFDEIGFHLNGVDTGQSIPEEPSAPVIPDITVIDTQFIEGATANFVVRLSEAATSPVSVDFATRDGSATAGSDYLAVSDRLVFAPGEVEKVIAVEVISDQLVEPDERFELQLLEAENARISVVSATATIQNDDQIAPPPVESEPPAVSSSDIDFQIDNDWGGGFTATMTITNTGSNPLENWSLTFTAPFAIEKIWSAELAAVAGGEVEIVPLSWNQTIAPGASVSFGFKGTKTTSGSQIPTGYQLMADSLDSSMPVPEPVNPAPAPEPESGEASSEEGQFDYGEALQKSFLFYEAQRSGALPSSNRIAWRGDSALNDGAEVGVDLSGGYYDAGDHVKFGLPMAASMTLLSWGVEEYREAYEQMGQLDEALDAIRWGTDYLLKAHISDGSETLAFWGQVGDGNLDHSYWGSPEAMTMARPAFAITPEQPGTDLAAEAAAALAAASIVFRPTDTAYANTLLENAQQLYTFADTYRGTYSSSIPGSADFYNSWSGYQDELAWGAIWLHEALEAQGSSSTQYLTKAEQEFAGINPGWTLNWDDKSYGTAVMLAQETGATRYRDQVETWLNSWLPGGQVTYTDGGLAWLGQWGSLRYAANTAFLAGIYGDTVHDPNGQYSDFASRQINYMLGDNPQSFSYMVGFGDDYPLNPHHRAASGTTDITDPDDNDYILYGALVGGPTAADDSAYVDSRTDYIANEVALDYNAAFTGALARLAGIYGGDPLTSAELEALPGITVPEGL